MAEYRFITPIGDEVKKLRMGDVLFLTGTVVTARDAGHRRALELLSRGEKLPIDMRGLAVYHMGPIVRKVENDWKVYSAGPTTSTRLETYEAEFLEKTGAKVIVGKGGMGAKTADACKRLGAAYAIYTGGAGALAAKSIKKVKGVEWLDLGTPEALWILEVEDFGPLTVIIDPEGRNLYEELRAKNRPNLIEAYKMMGVPV
ncbi:MAG TPA: FumA C-terminus/TtdB family hydratase beta subunit [Nitrososphaerales archaeon]|nr:FumA C-terminus/TtdB family hydratase beta subunit [Nitrososphaerales archaeon]